MATKYEIKKFLGAKAIGSFERIRMERDSMLDDAVDTFIIDHSSLILPIRETITELDSRIKKLNKALRKDGTGYVNKSYYGNPSALVNELTESFSKSGVTEKFGLTSYNDVTDKYKLIIQDAKNEYERLIAVTQSMTAKDGIEFLKNLGFDVMELEIEKQSTALITNIDAHKLFIN